MTERKGEGGDRRVKKGLGHKGEEEGEWVKGRRQREGGRRSHTKGKGKG